MMNYPVVDAVETVTVILPVMDEPISLKQTVDVILRDVSRKYLREFLIVVCEKTTAEAMAAVNRLQKEMPDLVVVHHQRLPFLGGALREAFDLSRGSHCIMMAPDLETDPNDVHTLIAEAQKNPSGMVTASRWQGGVRFKGYSKIKLVCNWVFQHFFSLLYGVPLSDMTFGYRIFPTRLVQAIRWEELRHPFLLETILKPLRLGVPVTEIRTGWRPRIEGESHNPFFRNFAYFRIGLRVRFASRHSILKSPDQPSSSAR